MPNSIDDTGWYYSPIFPPQSVVNPKSVRLVGQQTVEPEMGTMEEFMNITNTVYTFFFVGGGA